MRLHRPTTTGGWVTLGAVIFLGAGLVTVALMRRSRATTTLQLPEPLSLHPHPLAKVLADAGWATEDLVSLEGKGPDSVAYLALPGTHLQLKVVPDASGTYRVAAINDDGTDDDSELPSDLTPGMSKSSIVNKLGVAGLI